MGNTTATSLGPNQARDRLRRRILRIHGSILAILGVTNASVATVGWLAGIGPESFLRDERLAHAGLIQAYLLAATLGVVLVLGSRQPVPGTWNKVGIATHLAILSAYAFHYDYFATVPNGELLRNGLFIHLGAIALETWALVGPTSVGFLRRSAPSVTTFLIAILLATASAVPVAAAAPTNGHVKAQLDAGTLDPVVLGSSAPW